MATVAKRNYLQMARDNVIVKNTLPALKRFNDYQFNILVMTIFFCNLVTLLDVDR